MPNGRCRIHGGKSWPAGILHPRYKHGFYSRDALARLPWDDLRAKRAFRRRIVPVLAKQREMNQKERTAQREKLIKEIGLEAVERNERRVGKAPNGLRVDAPDA